MKWAVYDIQFNSPNFDFFSFLQRALYEGAEGIRFIKDPKGDQERFDSIIGAACKLMVLPTEFVDQATYKDVVYPKPSKQRGAHKAVVTRGIPKPYPVMPSQEALDRVNDILKGAHPPTVTIRNYRHQEVRNSGLAWRQWAEDHGAVVIEDYFDKKITLDERLAYYELSNMNLGVNGGPMVLNVYSHRPYIVMRMYADAKATTPGYYESHGWGNKVQMPYATNKQKLVWSGSDSYEDIEREFKEVMSR